MNSGRKIVVGCDLFLPLRLYSVPPWVLEKITQRFSNLEIVPVNIPGQSSGRNDIDVYWGNRITPDFVENCDSLQWVHFGSVGVDRARHDSVAARNIIVTSSRGIATAPMTASALAMITSLARGMHWTFKLRNTGTLTRESFDVFFDSIHDLEGQEILIVGLGEVGRRLSSACAALGMNVTAVNRSPGTAPHHVERTATLEELKNLVVSADYVVDLLPLNEETRHVFDEEMFGRMKESAFFINLGRGETVVESAMISALATGTIAGAGLDVFDVEPLSGDSPLWGFENVIITPHVSAISPNYWRRQLELFLFNIEKFATGDHQSMKNVENIHS